MLPLEINHVKITGFFFFFSFAPERKGSFAHFLNCSVHDYWHERKKVKAMPIVVT
jgi:hypothetical protein